MTEVRCRYLFKKGKREGEQCTVKKVVDDGLCRTHMKYAGTIPHELPVETQEPPQVTQEPEVTETRQIAQVPQEHVSGLSPTNDLQISIPKETVPVRVNPSPDREILWLDDPNCQSEEELEQEPALSKDPLEMTQAEVEKVPPKVAENEIFEIEISRYYSTIPVLKELLPPETRGSTPAKEWLTKLRTLGAHMGAELNMQMLFSVMCTAIEGYGKGKGFEVDGYKEIMMKDETTKQLLRLVALKNTSKLANIPPEMQLIGMMSMSFMGLHKSKVRMNQQPPT